MRDQPDGEREGGGADDRARGDVARPGDDGDEDDRGRDEGQRGQAEIGAGEAGDGFAALAAEEDGEGVSGHDGEGGGGHPQRAFGGEIAGEPDGGVALGDVEEEGRSAGGPAGGAQDVGGADVAAPGGANVA